MTDYEAIGGAAALAAIISDFVDFEARDFIVGFLFEGRDLDRIKVREVEFAARHLGGPDVYTGRPLPSAHKPLRINAGQFRRRLAILATILRRHGVDEAIVERWLAHERALEPLITDGSDCVA
jgi:truncated hemoglobin YjbI